MVVLTEYTSGSADGSGYNITVVFEGTNWTADLQEAFIGSADYFSTLITDDLADITGDFGDGLGVRTIDDLEISATLDSIDGSGGVLGSAGPDFIRNADTLPVVGSMTFDVADAQNLFDAEQLEGTGDWVSVVLHEMLHTMGFGSLWAALGLINNDGTTTDPDYHFTGANALNEYEYLYPTEYAADADPSLGVPVESSTGFSGTDGGHWTEAIFDTELMTGFLNGKATLSNLSVAALVDMGYAIDSFTPSVTACFTAGTSIRTVLGPQAVETLSIGDEVRTLDHSFRPIRWIGSCKLDAIDLIASPKLRPVRILAGSLGKNIPEKDLTVSPQHRMLVQSEIVKRMFDTTEILVPAVKLLGLDGVDRVEDAAGVEYFHILFDTHEVIFANGAPSESLYIGPQAMKSMSPEARNEITALFPEICDENYAPTPARVLIQKNAHVAKLLERHLKNKMPLLART